MTSTAPPLFRKQPLSIACLQYDPKLKDVEGNTRRVETFLRGLRPKEVDLLVCPEMFLTGYMFTSAADIQPFLEPPRIGRTSLFCRELATRYKCWVVGGYPELAGYEGDQALPGYNSAVLVSPTGEVMANYRKSFLYDTDKTWAREGDGFKVYDLPPPLNRTVLGICMDLNPKDFIAPFDAYELANFVKNNDADTLIVPMNWLQPPQEPPDDDSAIEEVTNSASEGPELSTLNYWAHRLNPLHDPSPGYSASTGTANPSRGKEVVFIACNRVGTESGTTFAGSSAVLTVSSNPSRIELIEAFGRREEGLMFARVN
ncbi:hypothetical protein NliqN6_1305 [Naganishia liquefaciens]|uniref:CN hydrolase domain-containing protein n=1 Tax=Naganishia liquefaciens TaxID=104408 RepID=A0A8H3TQ66_9TREE|nr:hypothetical protein NliqN6_1305 [Naganishia liquefaciens]